MNCETEKLFFGSCMQVPALDRLHSNTLKLCATWHMVPKSYLKGAELINYKEDPGAPPASLVH